MIRGFVDRALSYLDARAEAVAIQTGSGTAETWDDYQKRVGRVQGIREAMTVLKDLAAKALQDDDD